MAVETDSWLNAELCGGRYSVKSFLGEGGMACVYLALDQSLQTEVVIKVPHAVMLRDPEFAARFRRETRVLVTLSHPHIVRILDIGELDGQPFLVLPFLAGGSLADRHQHSFQSNERSLGSNSLGGWLPQVADALDFVHRRGYVHRDVKPGNILFDNLDHAFLGDFGIVKAFAGSAAAHTAALTAAGLVVGTPEYLAPECVMGEKIDGRADQYALAVTVYEILSGDVPFRGETPAAVIVHQCTQAPAPLSSRNPKIGEAVSEAVMRALSKKPSERFQTCSEFVELLIQRLAQQPVVPAPQKVTKEVAVSKSETISVDAPRVMCPKCGRLLRLRPQMMSSVARCPKCSHSFDVTPLLAGRVPPQTPVELDVKVSQSTLTARRATPSSRSRFKLAAKIVAAMLMPVLLVYLTIQMMSEPNLPRKSDDVVATTNSNPAPPSQKADDPDYLLALKLQEGCGERVDQARSRELFRRAADRGHLLATAYLANDAWNGCLGGKIDKDEGIRRYQKILPDLKQLADRGDAMAQSHYGLVLYDGIGVPKEEAQGVSWWLKAADQGLAVAQIDLGAAASSGRGMPKDDSVAIGWYRKAAEQNHATAQYLLGFMSAEGRGVTKNDTEAVRWYRKAAEQNYVHAQKSLGHMYADGRGVTNDDTEAVRWFVKAAEQNHVAAQYWLGVMYAEGRGVTQDESEAVRWYRKAAEQNDASSQNRLGAIYADGRGVAKDEAEAVRWYRKAAEQNYVYAQDSLGDMYSQGRGVPKDEAEAVRWYRKAAEQNYVHAQNSLGDMYAEGRGVTKDEVEAARWYRKAAEQDYVYAQYFLGMMYEEGRGVTKDEAEAIRWFRKAAEKNDAYAQDSLGDMYADGRGVTRDEMEAVRWYRKAAEQNLVYAQDSLGAMYAEGRGVAKDEAEAVRWFAKAAEKNHANAQDWLGVMYAEGRGVKKDEVKAVGFYRKAAEQNHAGAQSRLGLMYAEGRGVTKNDAEAVRWLRKAAEQNHAWGQYNLGFMYLEGRGVLRSRDSAALWLREAAHSNDAEAAKSARELLKKNDIPE